MPMSGPNCLSHIQSNVHKELPCLSNLAARSCMWRSCCQNEVVTKMQADSVRAISQALEEGYKLMNCCSVLVSWRTSAKVSHLWISYVGFIVTTFEIGHYKVQKSARDHSLCNVIDGRMSTISYGRMVSWWNRVSEDGQLRGLGEVDLQNSTSCVDIMKWISISYMSPNEFFVHLT